MNENERGITPADVTAMTVSMIGVAPASAFDRRWSVIIEQGNGDVIKDIELTEMERIQLGLMLSFADIGEIPMRNCSFVDFNRRQDVNPPVRG